jgi:hypothetical protein
MTYEEQLNLKSKVEEITGQPITQNIQAPYDEIIASLVSIIGQQQKAVGQPKKKAKKEKGE